MIELYNLGISESTIKNMLEMESSINDLTEREIKGKIVLLEELKCSKDQIVNIISSNSHYLNRTNGEIVKLIESLLNHGFKTLNILLDSNPYILNLEPFEIDNYIETRKNSGESLEDIIDDLDSNPYLFNEM